MQMLDCIEHIENYLKRISFFWRSHFTLERQGERHIVEYGKVKTHNLWSKTKETAQNWMFGAVSHTIKSLGPFTKSKKNRIIILIQYNPSHPTLAWPGRGRNAKKSDIRGARKPLLKSLQINISLKHAYETSRTTCRESSKNNRFKGSKVVYCNRKLIPPATECAERRITCQQSCK